MNVFLRKTVTCPNNASPKQNSNEKQSAEISNKKVQTFILCLWYPETFRTTKKKQFFSHSCKNDAILFAIYFCNDMTPNPITKRITKHTNIE